MIQDILDTLTRVADDLEAVADREAKALGICDAKCIPVGEFSRNYPSEQMEHAAKVRWAVAQLKATTDAP